MWARTDNCRILGNRPADVVSLGSAAWFEAPGISNLLADTRKGDNGLHRRTDVAVSSKWPQLCVYLKVLGFEPRNGRWMDASVRGGVLPLNGYKKLLTSISAGFHGLVSW